MTHTFLPKSRSKVEGTRLGYFKPSYDFGKIYKLPKCGAYNGIYGVSRVGLPLHAAGHLPGGLWANLHFTPFLVKEACGGGRQN